MVEVGGVYDLRSVFEDFVVEQHGAEDVAFSVEVLREWLFGKTFCVDRGRARHWQETPSECGDDGAPCPNSAAPALAIRLTSGSARSMPVPKDRCQLFSGGRCRVRILRGGSEVIDELRDKLREPRRRRDLAENRVGFDERGEFFLVHGRQEIAELIVDGVEP